MQTFWDARSGTTGSPPSATRLVVRAHRRPVSTAPRCWTTSVQPGPTARAYATPDTPSHHSVTLMAVWAIDAASPSRRRQVGDTGGMTVVIACGLLIAVGLTAGWRWGGLQFQPPPAAEAPADVARRYVWCLAVATVSGLGAGVL